MSVIFKRLKEGSVFKNKFSKKSSEAMSMAKMSKEVMDVVNDLNNS